MKIFETFEKTTEVIGWIQIFLSIFLFSAVISALIYFPFKNLLNLIAGCLILILGILFGIRIENLKEKGPFNFYQEFQKVRN